MLIAIAGVHTARILVSDEPDRQRLALMRFAGYGLSGLAFALVTRERRRQRRSSRARTPWRSLFWGWPSMSRRCARIAIRRFSIWPSAPSPRAAWAHSTFWPSACTRSKRPCGNCLVIPIACLSRSGRSWASCPTSAWACFHSGSPGFGMTSGSRGTAIISAYRLSVAACIWSGFEPLAGLICLSLYAVLYLLAIWVFRRTVGDVSGRRRSGGRLLFRHDAGAGDHAGRSGSGRGDVGFCLLGDARRASPPACGARVSRSLAQAGLALMGAAMFAASGHLLTVGAGSWTGAGAFGVIAVLAFLLNRERPRPIWAYLGAAELRRVHDLRPRSGAGRPEPRGLTISVCSSSPMV